ncbi:hypothetical protein V9T40_003888 [Parthenolecanium corni]|uniref:Uncharacterized protein n=1 Tax=Parthenolecanium corni TaxID=536013 RepID=A0AAN9TEA4_9HEMI
MSYRSYDSRYDRHSRFNSSYDRSSSRSHHHSRPSTSRYDWSRDTSSRHSGSSSRSSESTSQKDKPFTIVKPSAEKSFTIIKPDEPCDFTIVTNQNNDFYQFTDPLQTLPRQSDIYSQLSLKQSNYFIFGSKTSSDVLKMSFLYAVARIIYERETDEALIPAIAAAEFAADYLPNNRRLFGSQADAYFKQVMAKAVRDPSFILKVRPNKDLYATLEEFGLPRVYPTLKPEPLNGEQYMRILQILSTSLDPAYMNCDLVISLTAIVPCLQLDSITLKFLSDLQDTVREELQKDITLDIKSTNIFFEQYLKEASEQEVEEMLVYWRLAIPESAKRLKLLLKRIPGERLRPIMLIGQVLTKCEDFPWEATLKLYPKDWKALDKAIRLINNDPFYGYRRDKDEIVNPRHYQNLAWLCWQLCIMKLQDSHLDFNLEEPSHAEEIQKLIASYVASTQQETNAMEET